MATRTVNPNRMELLNLKRELAIARRGHKMLKDKRDELMRRFLTYIDENGVCVARSIKRLRVAMRGPRWPARSCIRRCWRSRCSWAANPCARPVLSDVSWAWTFPSSACPKSPSRASPALRLRGTSPELDAALRIWSKRCGMLQLAEVEKTVQLLAAEIERTRRHVNSLEHVKIPELEALIRSITLKWKKTNAAI